MGVSEFNSRIVPVGIILGTDGKPARLLCREVQGKRLEFWLSPDMYEYQLSLLDDDLRFDLSNIVTYTEEGWVLYGYRCLPAVTQGGIMVRDGIIVCNKRASHGDITVELMDGRGRYMEYSMSRFWDVIGKASDRLGYFYNLELEPLRSGELLFCDSAVSFSIGINDISNDVRVLKEQNIFASDMQIIHTGRIKLPESLVRSESVIVPANWGCCALVRGANLFKHLAFPPEMSELSILEFVTAEAKVLVLPKYVMRMRVTLNAWGNLEQLVLPAGASGHISIFNCSKLSSITVHDDSEHQAQNYYTTLRIMNSRIGCLDLGHSSFASVSLSDTRVGTMICKREGIRVDGMSCIGTLRRYDE